MPQITINFSHTAYPDLKRKFTEVSRTLGHEVARTTKPLKNEMPKTMRGIKEDVGFTVITPLLRLTACLRPTLRDNSEQIKQQIMKLINDIRKESHCSDEDVNAVIFGGVACDSSDKISESSCRLVDTLEEACNCEGIEPTIITGQYKMTTSLTHMSEKSI